MLTILTQLLTHRFYCTCPTRVIVVARHLANRAGRLIKSLQHTHIRFTLQEHHILTGFTLAYVQRDKYAQHSLTLQIKFLVLTSYFREANGVSFVSSMFTIA